MQAELCEEYRLDYNPHHHPKNRQSQDWFCCIECGHAENADVNAAKNIKELGLIELAKPDEETKVKKRTAGKAGIACYDPVSSKAQKRAKALQAK